MSRNCKKRRFADFTCDKSLKSQAYYASYVSHNSGRFNVPHLIQRASYRVLQYYNPLVKIFGPNFGTVAWTVGWYDVPRFSGPARCGNAQQQPESRRSG